MGDIDFSVFGLVELELVEIGAHNGVIEYRGQTAEVVGEGDLILIRLSFWSDFWNSNFIKFKKELSLSSVFT